MKKGQLSQEQVDIINEANFASSAKGAAGVEEVLRRHGITAETLAEWKSHVMPLEEFLRMKGWDQEPKRRKARKPARAPEPIEGTPEEIAERFDKWSTALNPRFVRKPSEGGDIPLRNDKEVPASAKALRQLESWLGGTAPDLLALYQRFDGARFFAYADDREQCFYFLPVDDMEACRRELEDWVFMDEEAARDYREEADDAGRLCVYGAPPWWDTVVVFAGFGYAPERLFVTPQKEHAGKVFFYDHDSDCSIQIAETVRHLLAQIQQDPAKFVTRFGTGFHDLQSYATDSPRAKGA